MHWVSKIYTDIMSGKQNQKFLIFCIYTDVCFKFICVHNARLWTGTFNFNSIKWQFCHHKIKILSIQNEYPNSSSLEILGAAHAQLLIYGIYTECFSKIIATKSPKIIRIRKGWQFQNSKNLQFFDILNLLIWTKGF